jgi:hypothetical protein
MRFALVVDEPLLALWHVRCLEHLTTVAALDLVVLANGTSHLKPPAHVRLLRRCLRATSLDRTIDVKDRFPGVERLSHISASNSARLDGLDFALGLGKLELAPTTWGKLRYGLWRFHHECHGDDLPFFRELQEGEGSTYAGLLMQGADGRAAVLEQGWFRTHRRSYAAQTEQVLSSIAVWPARACGRLSVEPRGHERAESPPAAPRRPTVRRNLIRYVARSAAHRLDFALDRVFRHPQWNIGLLRVPASQLLQASGYNDRDIEWFPLAGRDRFLADPFGLRLNGALYLLCEEYPYKHGRGRIAAVGWPEHGAEVVEALSLPVHASYPCLVEDRGRLYCVPETAHANEVALYECVDFPSHWNKVAVLLQSFPGVDPTVFRHDGRWWLMCTERGRDEDAALWVWHATELRGPWKAHARNPVKTDVRGARPGGLPFQHDGALYRPTQDCSKRYGWRIAIQRVVLLTPSEFIEERVVVLQADEGSPFPLGRHTLSPVGDAVLIDGHRRVFVWTAFRAFIAVAARGLAARFLRTRRSS